MKKSDKEERIIKLAKKLKIKLSGTELKPYNEKLNLRKENRND